MGEAGYTERACLFNKGWFLNRNSAQKMHKLIRVSSMIAFRNEETIKYML